jgi:hypothetical protein
MTPRLYVRAVLQGQALEFELRPHGINGLLGISVTDNETRKLLWDLDLEYFRGSRLVYGGSPGTFRDGNGNWKTAKQVVPEPGLSPARLPKGKVVTVEIRYQYDSFLGACVAREAFTLDLAHDGETRLERINGGSSR